MAEYVFKISCKEEGKGFCYIYPDVSKCFIKVYICEYKQKLIEKGNYFLNDDYNLIKKNEG